MEHTALSLGLNADGASHPDRARLLEYLCLKLASCGFPPPPLPLPVSSPALELGQSLISGLGEKLKALGAVLAPVDQAIDGFLRRYFIGEVEKVFAPGETLVPAMTLNLSRHGLARELSLPIDGDEFHSEILSSWRVVQGVCHNPASDRRTTEGVFHVAEGGLPVPADKKSVPRAAAVRLLYHALRPPPELLLLPFTASQPEEGRVRTFVSLMLRPLVCPEVPGVMPERRMETRFFAPGTLVSNLDFVETIFGNAGDPFLPLNDARLDPDGWSGHSGAVILAPHLIRLKKIDLGLPHVRQATPAQKRDGMCWENEDELYNDGGAFKLAIRDASGVMVTLIADSYYGYCKKEVKTQISFASNLSDRSEEEHAGGALVFPSADLGESFQLSHFTPEVNHTWAEVSSTHAAGMDLHADGYGTDRLFPDIFYVPENVRMDLREQRVTWQKPDGETVSLKLLPGRTFVMPSGYKVEMAQPAGKGMRWRLVGTQAEGTFCHKPCTVSGGGKSEISKPISDAMISGPVLVGDFQEDMKYAAEVIARDFSDRFKNPRLPRRPSRPILDPDRSFGSVVRLLTPSELYTDAYNAWLKSLPVTARDLVLVVKRRYRGEWGADWQSRFSVDVIDGRPGHTLKFYGQALATRYLRVGFAEDGSWRTFSLRKDFAPSVKLQREDDITASTTVPASKLTGLHPKLSAPAYKFSDNCEFRLFQRPDDAVIRGYDRQTEAEFAQSGHFFSNYEPLSCRSAADMTEDVIRFDQFTPPMQDLIRRAAVTKHPAFFVCTANPRLVNGKPTKNPRYLQTRPDLLNPRSEYLAAMGARLYRRLPGGAPVLNPVHAALPGRRNNPAVPGSGLRPLAVYGPVHYQELPELFADFIASLTGKSPSTTGAGSEGALTKSPFNALLPVHDLNAALLSYIETKMPVFSTAAGHIGSKYAVEHDISITIPEVWSRMHLHERDPEWLLDHGCLEVVRDFTHEGRVIPASRLGYRITAEFVQRFFGRVFSDSLAVFPEDMLRPELQSLTDFVDGVEHIAEGQEKAARMYFEDGSVKAAIPPLQALLHIIVHGNWQGHGMKDAAFRELFDREAVMQSAWYQARLHSRAENEQHHRARGMARLKEALTRNHLPQQVRGELQRRLVSASR